MKILYIGKDRRNAQAVATALRSIAPKVTLLWAQSLDQCAKCLDENRDVAALVVDAQVSGNWPSSLKDLRSLQDRPAIVLVVPEGARPQSESLGPPPDGYVTNGQTFLRDLPLAVTRAVTRVRGSEPASLAPNNDGEPQQLSQVTSGRTEDDGRVHLERTARAALEQKLAETTAALQDARQRHAAAMASALMAHEVAATEQLTEQERQFQAQITLEQDKRRTVEEMLAEASSAIDEAEKRYASALTDAAAQTRELEQARARAAELTERERHLDRELSQAAADRDRIKERLTAAEAALDQARRESQIVSVDIERLRQHEADLSAQIADLQIVRDDLDRQLVDASRTIERAGQREAELLGQNQHERATRAALEQAAADADANLRETRQRHDAALAAVAGELAEHRAQSDRELSRTASERDKLKKRLEDTEASLTQFRRDHESAAADIARLTQRERDLSAQLANVEGARHLVERKLSDAQREIADAAESAARERGAADKRHADLELRVVQELSARETLERTLKETRSAALDAERWFKEEADALRAQGLEREAEFDARLASERLEHDSRLAEMQKECDRVGQAHAAADKDVQRLSADLSEATRILEDTRREFQSTIDRLSTEHVTVLAAFAVLIAERNERLKEETMRHDVSLRASENARAELQERLEAALSAGREEIEQVQEKLMATVQALEATKRRREVLQTEADRSSEPHEQRDESRAKSVRAFADPRLAALHNPDSALV
jgi:hypothetical protein